MKKIILALLCIVLPFTFIGCKDKKTEVDKLEDYISTYQNLLYTGENENLNISIVGLTQEEIFVTDGEIGKIINETTLRVKPLEAKYLDYEYSYKIDGEKGNLTGSLDKDLLGISFSTTLDNIDSIGKITKVTLTYNNTESSFDMTNQLSNSISYKAALKKAYSVYEDKINKLLDSKDFDREIYIRLVTDSETTNKEYYWYVSFIKNSEDYWASLIDLNGEVITSRVKTPS